MPDATMTPLVGKPKRLRSLLRWTRNLLAIIGAILLVYHLFFDVSKMVSPSMSPTLRGSNTRDGDWVLTERISTHFRRPRRWELVQFRDEEGVLVIKRVVGLPGEKIAAKDGRPIVDGSLLEPPDKLRFLYYFQYGPFLHSGKQAECGDGYFVMGDDSRDSFDSRFTGPLKPEEITGRPLLIVWPLKRFGWVNP